MTKHSLLGTGLTLTLLLFLLSFCQQAEAVVLGNMINNGDFESGFWFHSTNRWIPNGWRFGFWNGDPAALAIGPDNDLTVCNLASSPPYEPGGEPASSPFVPNIIYISHLLRDPDTSVPMPVHDLPGLQLDFDVKVVSHEMAGGDQGLFPVSLLLSWRDSTGGAHWWEAGFATNGSGYVVPPNQWNHFSFNLFSEIPGLHSIDDLWIGGGGSYFEGKIDNIQLSAIPEPCTIILTGLGLLTTAGFMRKRR